MYTHLKNFTIKILEKLIINKIIIILQKFNTNINEYQFKFTFFVKFWFHKQGIEVQATLLYPSRTLASILKMMAATWEHTSPNLKLKDELSMQHLLGQ